MSSYSFGNNGPNEINLIETIYDQPGGAYLQLIHKYSPNSAYDLKQFKQKITDLTGDTSPQIVDYNNGLIYKVTGSDNLRRVCEALDRNRAKYPLSEHFTRVFLERVPSQNKPNPQAQQQAPHPHKGVLDALTNYIQKEQQRLPPGEKYERFETLRKRVSEAYRKDNVGEIQSIIMDTAKTSLHRRHSFWDSLLDKLGFKSKSEVKSFTNFKTMFSKNKDDSTFGEAIKKGVELKEEDTSPKNKM